MNKKKIIVYGMGGALKSVIHYLDNEFDIVGFSDKAPKEKPDNFINPEDIEKYTYDYVYITSSKYLNEIKEELIQKFGKQIEQKIISKEDVFGDFRNDQIRDEWIIKKLQEIPAGKVLLDAGAGIMRYKPYCGHLKYIAQDFGGYDVFSNGTWDTSGVDIVSDIIDMPLEDESVDVILCSEVFEHLKNPILAVEEFGRVLKFGGKLILTAPVCSLTHQVPFYFSNGFSEYWYKENLKDFGFEIEEIVPNGNYFKYLSQELFRVDGMAETYCNDRMEPDERRAMVKIMKMFSRLSAKDNGSNERLCFGYMLTAKKV